MRTDNKAHLVLAYDILGKSASHTPSWSGDTCRGVKFYLPLHSSFSALLSAFVMRATMYLALLLTILQSASALQLLPRTRTYSTPSTRTTVRLSNYLDQISSDSAASKLAEADAAAAEADRLSSQAAALVAEIREEKETTSPLPPPVAAPEPVVPEETLPAPAPAADRLASRLARVPPPAEDISSFVSETLTPEYAPETTAVAGAALLAAGAVQCINQIG